MHDFLKSHLPRGTGVNFVAHSMGGLDCRHLISTIKPTSYTPLSLTTIGTPHRGSPFMDWCAANIGVGTATATAVAAAAIGAERAATALPYSLKSPLLSRPRRPEDTAKKDEGGFSGFTSALTNYLLNIFDSPAYSNLTTSFLRDHFNPNTPDDTRVKYTSVAGRIAKMSVLHPLWFPKLVLDAAAENGYGEDQGRTGKEYEGNDGLVSISSAKWGEFLGAVDDCHHWDLRGEGGLFPQAGSVTLEAEGEAKRNGQARDSEPGGWDFGDGLVGGMGEYLGLSKESDGGKGEAMAKTQRVEKEKNKAKERDSGPSSWDIIQVGQVLDWVTDLLPGGKSTETGKKQLADAQMEKERADERRAEREREGKSGDRSEAGKEKRKKEREKFDLARFYGGLMIKLREDGF
jgi:triacylglycerol lipase